MTGFRNGLIYFLLDMLLCLPILPVLEQQVEAASPIAQAAAPTLSKSDVQQRCQAGQDPSTTDVNTLIQNLPAGLSSQDLQNATDDIYNQFSDDNLGLQYVLDQDIQSMPFYDVMKGQLDKLGAKDGVGWWVCQSEAQDLTSLLPVTDTAQAYFSAIENAQSKIAFKNQQDLYALTGEPCRKFIGSVCDETTKQVAVIDPSTGKKALNADGSVKTKAQPIYYDDVGWINGHWDAPKADLRILKTLLWLVTPVTQGGAGHEFIRVGSIVQDTKKNAEFQATSTPGPNAPPPEDASVANAHSYDSQNPESPTKIAQALDIDQIDKIRVTTKIIKRKHGAEILGSGHDDVNFQFNSFPIQVGWQTTAGIANSPPPNPSDFYTGSQQAFSSSITDLLNQMGIAPGTFNLGTVSIGNFGDISKAIGQGLLAQMINVPLSALGSGSPDKRLAQLGKAYAAKNLSISTSALLRKSLSHGIQVSTAMGNALADQAAPAGFSADDLADQAGRSLIEQELGLPIGSLDGSTSQEIQQSIGRRYLEETIFQVSPGTLDGAIASQDDFFSRLGAGKIEQYYGLETGSLRSATTLDALLKSSPAADQLFSLTDEDASQIDDELGLSPSDTSAFPAAAFSHPTQDLVDGKIDFALYKRLVGNKAEQNSIGHYSDKTTDDLLGGLETAPYGTGASGGLSINDSRLIADSNFIAHFLFNDLQQDGPYAVYPNYPKDFPGLPSLSAIEDTAANSQAGKLLVQYGAFTPESLRSLIDRAENSLYQTDPSRTLTGGRGEGVAVPVSDQRTLTNSLGVANQADCTASLAACLEKRHNDIVSYWRPTFQTALQKLNDSITANNLQDPDDPTAVDQAALRSSATNEVSTSVSTNGTSAATIFTAKNLLTKTIALINAYDDGLAHLESMQGGQSGRSAALGLPGIMPAVSLSNCPGNASVGGCQTSSYVYQQDMGNQIAAGAITPTLLKNLGRAVVAKQSTTSAMGQLLLAGAMDTNHDGSYGLFDSTTVSPSDVIAKGLSKEDFEKIFTKDLGGEVFFRTGALQLLNQKSDQPSQNTTSDQDKQINPSLLNAQQDQSFYRSRLTDALNTASLLPNKSAALQALLGSYYSDGKLKDLSSAVIPALQAAANGLEPLLLPSLNCNEASCQKTFSQASQVLRSLEEIIAGQSLDMTDPALAQLTPDPATTTAKRWDFTSEAYAAGVDVNTYAETCTAQQGGLLGIMQSTTLASQQALVDTVSQKTGSCLVEQAFNLPRGSMDLYLALGKAGSYSLANLETAVGLANRNLTLAAAYDPLTVRGEGAAILNGRAVPALISAVPGFSLTASQYNLSENDIVAVISGNATPLMQKVGSFMLDKQFNWPAGTTGNLISPCGITNNPAKDTACDPEKARLSIMGSVGLNKLGQQLGFPTGFDITQGGSIFSNFGLAYVSQILNLPAPSLQGNFLAARSKIAPETILAAFGIATPPQVSQLLELKNSLQQAETAAIRQGGGTSDAQSRAEALLKQANGLVDQTVTASYKQVLDDLGKSDSPFWQPNANDPTAASQLAKDYLLPFTQALNQIKASLQGDATNSALAQPYVAAVDDAINKASGPSLASSQTALTNLIGSFQSRIIGLQKQLVRSQPNAALPQIIQGPLGQYLQGKKDIGALAVEVGSDYLTGPGGLLTEGVLTSQFKDNPYVSTALTLFKSTFASGPGCDTMNIEDYFKGKDYTHIAPGQAATHCSLTGVGNVDFHSLLDKTQVRTSLFDTFLAHSFSSQVESTLKLPAGTIRSMVVDPKDSADIISTVGFNLLAQQLNPSPADNTPIADTQRLLAGAFLSGFYDVGATGNNFSLSPKRAIDNLGIELSAIAQNEYGRRVLPVDNVPLAKVAGITITGSDLFAALSGNITTFTSNSLEQYISSLNQGILHPTGQAPDPRAAGFTINYADVRSSLGLPVSREELAAASLKSQLSYVKANMSDTDRSACSSAGQTLINCYQTRHPEEGINLQNASIQGQASYPTESKQNALNNLRYEALDAIAFKADPNIPKGFARTMLEGNSQDRIRSMGTYIIASIGTDKSVRTLFPHDPKMQLLVNTFMSGLAAYAGQGFKDVPGGVSSTELQDLFTGGGELFLEGWAGDQLKKATGIDLSQGVDSYAEGWLGNTFEKNTGIKLPAGFMNGLVNWGMDGFDTNAFTTDFAKVKIDNISLGSSLNDAKDVLTSQAYDWASKQMHIPVQQLKDIVTKGVALYNNIKGFINGKVSGAKLGASAVAFVVALGEALFGKEIAAFEQSLGMPPGTINQLLNMFVDLLSGNWVKAAIDLVFAAYTYLFGVYRTDYIITASADGYYPIRPDYLTKNGTLLTPTSAADTVDCDLVAPEVNNWSNGHETCRNFHPPHDEVESASLLTGDFDAQNQSNYNAGILKAAQSKVGGLVRDLAEITDICREALCGKPQDIWISQVFTGRQEDIDAVNRLVSRNAPWDAVPGWGYGPLSERTMPSGNDLVPRSDYRAGFFAGPAFADHVHVRW